MGMNIIRELPHPTEIKNEHPLSAELIAVREQRDKEIKAVFAGESDKFLLIIGPCSADSEEPVLDYITRLRQLQEKVADKILMIPRIFQEKLVPEQFSEFLLPYQQRFPFPLQFPQEAVLFRKSEVTVWKL